jgi:hypothetical protein
VSGSAKEGRPVAIVGFIFFGVSRLMMGVPFVPNEKRTRRPPLLPPSFFFGRLAAGVAVDADAVGGGLFPTTTTGSIFSSLILICFVGIRFLFAASVASDEMVLTELGGIVGAAASGAKSDSGTNVDGEEGGCESLIFEILLVLGGELFRAEAAAPTPVGDGDDGVFGSGVRGVDVWSCDDERKASTVVCVKALSSFMMCSSKGGCSDPRLRKGVDKKRRG